jgi:small ubiquitin-related modifier
MSDEDAKPEENSNEPITIRVKDQTGEETMFKIKKSTKMSKVFSAYAQRKGVEQASLRFLLDGERISETDTPKMLELEDEDQIDCVLAQVGGAEGGDGEDDEYDNETKPGGGGRGGSGGGRERADHDPRQGSERRGDHVQDQENYEDEEGLRHLCCAEGRRSQCQ